MPFYEYACSSCDHEFETMQKISDEPLKICPACGKEKLEKMVSAPKFQLKGNGWYVTDFRDKKSSEQKNNSSSAETTIKPVEASSETTAVSQTSSSDGA